MEREIKFRAWDSEIKVMSDEFSIFGEFTLLGAVHDWQMEIRNIETVLENGDGPNLIEMLRELKVMQSTGLKDKNGVEIYEGDIIRFDERVASVGHVVYDNDSFKCKMHAFGIFWKLRHKQTSKKNHGEVIGNIYENPDLLTKAKT